MSRRSFLFGLLLALVGANILVFVLVFSYKPVLTVSILDVGQGDAILIQTPSGTDLLIDGGRDRSVLRELPKQLGPLDRSIDVVIATHPDADHIVGLASVLAHYNVSYFMESGVQSSTTPSLALKDAVGKEKGVTILNASRGTRIHLGSGAYVDMLFPDRTLPRVETNTGSIVLRVVYGKTSFLFSGDSPASIEEWLVRLDGSALKSDVLKAGHHGSRTSTGESFLSAVDPVYVVVSAGKDNSYGHPHQEVLDRVTAEGATLLQTLGGGAVTFVSDGTTLRVR